MGREGWEVREKMDWCVAREGECCSRGEGAKKGDPGRDAPLMRCACSCCRWVAAPIPACTPPSAGEMAPVDDTQTRVSENNRYQHKKFIHRQNNDSLMVRVLK